MEIKVMLNQVFPVSYKTYRKHMDETYDKLKGSLKKDWLATQHSFFSSPMALIIFLLTLAFFSSFEFIDLFDITNKKTIMRIFMFLGAFLILAIRNLFVSIIFLDKYTDEKYLEMSKSIKKKGTQKIK